MKTIKLFTVLFLAMGIAITSCKKGDMGDPGPIGETGAAGEAGAQGEQGIQGEDGNANVIASDWMDTDFDDESTTYTDFDIEIPNLTRSEIDESAILVYFTNGFRTYPAPYVESYIKFGYQLQDNSDGGYDLILIGSTMDGNAYTFDWMEEFRYVIIPQGVSASGKSAGIDYNKMSYEEVMDHLGLDY